jgi:hypothetical protein
MLLLPIGTGTTWPGMVCFMKQCVASVATLKACYSNDHMPGLLVASWHCIAFGGDAIQVLQVGSVLGVLASGEAGTSMPALMASCSIAGCAARLDTVDRLVAISTWPARAVALHFW